MDNASFDCPSLELRRLLPVALLLRSTWNNGFDVAFRHGVLSLAAAGKAVVSGSSISAGLRPWHFRCLGRTWAFPGKESPCVSHPGPFCCCWRWDWSGFSFWR